MDKLTLTNTRDFPWTTNSAAFMQAAYAIFEQLGNIGGDNIIVSGCTVTGSSAAPGYMFLKGKLMPFLGGTIQTNVKIVTVINDVNVDAGVRQQTSYQASFGTSTNPDENVVWTSIVRIDSNKALMTQIADILGQIDQLDTDITANATDIALLEQNKLDKSQAAGFKLMLTANVSAAGVATKINGSLDVTAERTGTGHYTITHDLGTSNYFVIANTKSSSLGTGSTDNTGKIAAISYANNSFEVITADDNTRDNWDFEFMLLQFTI